MFRQLFHIVIREYKLNLAIFIELVLVALLIVYLSDWQITKLRLYNEPLGSDIEHVYKLQVKSIGEDVVSHQPPTDTTDKTPNATYAYALLERLKTIEGVEAVSLSLNSMPYQGSNSIMPIYYDTCGVRGLQQRLVTPGFVQVLKIPAIGGTPDDLAKSLEEGNCSVSRTVLEQLNIDPESRSWIGKRAYESPDTTATLGFPLGEASENFRAMRDTRWTASILVPFQLVKGYIDDILNTNVHFFEFAIRVKPEADVTFMENFKNEHVGKLREGNLYIGSISSLPSIKEGWERPEKVDFKNMIRNVLFLLLSALLGVIGAFWYRIQQRRGEIGVRLAMGDTPARLQGWYIAEGLLLLALTLPIVVLGAWLMLHYDLTGMGWLEYSWRLPIALVSAYIPLVVIIVIASWLPTRKAVRISPAIAIREE